MKPIIKWVGGKTQILNDISSNLPMEEFSRYIEPFLGGGAVLFKLKPNVALVNDLNQELMNTYKVVKEFPKLLMEELDNHEENHSEEYFYTIRALDRNEEFKRLSNVYRASRFIFLNKAGFNGMYRVNSKGQMNVPFNKKDFVSLYTENNIKKVSKYLNNNNIQIISKDYHDFLKENVTKDDFVYIDPPYDPVNKTSNFTAYHKNGFDEQDQINLRNMCIEIDERGAKFLLSNSDTDFINELYDLPNFIIKKVYATRRINSDGKGRGKIKEVLIRNYKVKGE